MALFSIGLVLGIQPVLSLLLLGSFKISEAVHIIPADEPIRAKDSNVMVILKCDFKTTTYETPQITWYQEKGAKRNKIMQYDIHSHLSSYGEFLNRVARGDAGALVLFRPTSRDSGKYTCEVEVDNENPSWAKNSVVLNVTEDPMISVACTPEPEINDKEGTKDLVVFIGFCFISSLLSMVVMYMTAISPSKKIFQRFQQKTARQTLILSAGPFVVVIALCLVFTGIVCSAVALSSQEEDSANYFHDVGLGTGVLGILILLGVTIVRLCFRLNPALTSKIPDAENGENEKALPADDTNGQQITVNRRSHRNATISGHESICLVSGSSTRLSNTEIGIDYVEGTIIKTPPGGQVTGMVAMSNNHFYLTTTSALFKINSKEMEFQQSYSSKKHLLMIAGHKDHLYIPTEDRTSQKKRRGESEILHRALNKINFDAVTVKSKSTVTWLHVGQHDMWLYLTMCNPAKVIRMRLDNLRSDSFGKNELQHPTCVIQNSAGQFIISDSHKNDIMVFEESGKYATSLFTRLPKKLENEITGCNRLAIGADDRIYASSPLSRNILVFSADFKFERLLPTRADVSGKISCLLVHDNSLYVAHEKCLRIYPLNPEQTFHVTVTQTNSAYRYKYLGM